MLYAQAAFLSELKGAGRRAALWYLVAADKLEKTGIVSFIRVPQGTTFDTKIGLETTSHALFSQGACPISGPAAQRTLPVVLGKRGPQSNAMGRVQRRAARNRA